MCGDSTCGGDVALLMNGEKADIAFYSPPYNAGFGVDLNSCRNKNKRKTKYTNGENENKTTDEYADFLIKTIQNGNDFSLYNFCNIQLLSNNKESIRQAIAHHFDKLGDVIIWDKQKGVPNIHSNVLTNEFEFVFMFNEKGNRTIGTIYFQGTKTNIIHIRPTHNEFANIHNAVFPIELPSHFISNFAKDSTLDLFGGTGTTLIACEQLNRKCYMMELDEHYCDVIIDRWQKLTGKTAVKIEQQ
jgi:site-specific DNA-methyltransferase (adenine-specific)